MKPRNNLLVVGLLLITPLTINIILDMERFLTSDPTNNLFLFVTALLGIGALYLRILIHFDPPSKWRESETEEV